MRRGWIGVALFLASCSEPTSLLDGSTDANMAAPDAAARDAGDDAGGPRDADAGAETDAGAADAIVSGTGDATCATGHIDPSFGVGGFAFFSETTDWIAGVAIDPTERIIVASTVRHAGVQIALQAFDEYGAPDPSFGGGTGLVYSSLDPFLSNDVTAGGLIIMRDGRIAVGGTVTNAAAQLFLARHLANGAPDPTFGHAGRAQIVITSSGADTSLSAIALADAAGTLEIAGVAGYRPFIARVTHNGDLDPVRPISLIDDSRTRFSAIAAVGGGAFAAGIYTHLDFDTDFLIARTTTGSTPRTELIDDGAYDAASDVAIDAAGRIVIAGTAGPHNGMSLAVFRRFADLTPDASFGTATATGSRSLTVAHSVAIFPSGEILAAGWSSDFINTDPLLAIFSDAGVLIDVLTFPVPGAIETYVYDVAIDPRGRIIVGAVAAGGRGFVARICR